MIDNLFAQTGLSDLSAGQVVMWAVGFFLIYLAIRKRYEPLLLLPMGFSIFVVNLPLTALMQGDGGTRGLFGIFYHYGLEWEVLPPLIFLGLGAMTDFGPLIANPKTILLGAAAQLGVYFAFFGAISLGFSIPEACSIGIIGGADGPTTIFVTAGLAPHLLGTTAVVAYSYMALVPIIQPPIMRLLTTEQERKIRMKQLRPVSSTEKILFPVMTSLLILLLVPKSAPLLAMFMLGNLFKESQVVERLTEAARNELINLVTIFLAIAVGASMNAATFLQPRTLSVLLLGLAAFSISSAGGILLAKLLNLFLKEKINPLIGSAGVSAVPMAARVSQTLGVQADPKNHLLMHAMGPNVAGVIGTVVAAGVFLTMAG